MMLHRHFAEEAKEKDAVEETTEYVSEVFPPEDAEQTVAAEEKPKRGRQKKSEE